MERDRLEEHVRQEAAALLHGSVQSALAACTVWLTMADELLTPDAIGPGDGAGVDVAARAAQLVRKARREVERLHKIEVPRAMHMLYPLLIGVGLRPALDGLAAYRTEAMNAPFSVEISAGDAFVAWDRPTSDPSVVHTRLEMYRIVEAIFQLLVESTEVEAVGVRLHFEMAGGRLRAEMCVRSDENGIEARRLSTVFADFERSGPVERLGRAGGTLEPIDAADDVFSLRVSLPLRDVSLGDGGT